MFSLWYFNVANKIITNGNNKIIIGVTYVANTLLNVSNSTYDESIKLADNIEIQSEGINRLKSVILNIFFIKFAIREIPQAKYIKVAGSQLKIYIDSTL